MMQVANRTTIHMAQLSKIYRMFNTSQPKSKADGYQIYLSRDWFEIAIEAPSLMRGVAGIKDYNANFERVLSRLGSMDGLLLGALLNTRYTASSAISSRLLSHPKLKYPVPLGTAVPSELRSALIKIAMHLHSEASAKSNGSSGRRISLFVRLTTIPNNENGLKRLREKLSQPARHSRIGL
jgi:hypothetical protein